jgi:thioredoxin-dependent peroxiredoxin
VDPFYDRSLYRIGISLMLAVGARAPEFTLPDQDGRDTSLTTLLNHGPLILFFYPADFTPGCTKEVCMMRDLHSELAARGLSVAGISPQGAASHRGFRAKHNLPFTLLSDAGKAVIAMYEVQGPLGIGVRRATYLIDPSRHIRDAVLADFRIARHEDFVRRAMALSSNHTHS